MRSKRLKVAEMLHLQCLEGVWRVACKPRKVSQNIVSQWYEAVIKMVSVSGNYEMIMIPRRLYVRSSSYGNL